MVRIPVDETRIGMRPLTPENLNYFSDFACGDEDLDDFLRGHAFRLQNENVVLTYLAFYEGEGVGYVSLLTDAVVLETKERKKLALGIHDHPIVPALKIARLGVSSSFRQVYRGLGEALVRFALATAEDVAELAGCRLLTVDAYPESVSFYAKLGFVANRAKPYQGKLHPSMRLDLFQAQPLALVH